MEEDRITSDLAKHQQLFAKAVAEGAQIATKAQEAAAKKLAQQKKKENKKLAKEAAAAAKQQAKDLIAQNKAAEKARKEQEAQENLSTSRPSWTAQESSALVELYNEARKHVKAKFLASDFNAAYTVPELNKFLQHRWGGSGLAERWTLEQGFQKWQNILKDYKEAVAKLSTTGSEGVGASRLRYPWWDTMVLMMGLSAATRPDAMVDSLGGIDYDLADMLGELG
ncbi:hypothetical protein DFS34DRAFT_604918, partial [Phlyctochytrium arcticum]